MGGILGGTVAAWRVNRRPLCSAAVAAEWVRTLSIAGAAGALSAFLGAPLVGAVFALEVLAPSAGWGGPAAAHSPAAAASVAAALVVCAVLTPSTALGGHFEYAAASVVPQAWPCAFLVPSFALGVAMGLLSTALSYGTQFGRRAAAAVVKRHNATLWPVLVPTAAGLCVGGLGVLWPQTLLWGETRLAALLTSAPACGTVHLNLASHALIAGGGFAELGASGALQVMSPRAGRFVAGGPVRRPQKTLRKILL